MRHALLCSALMLTACADGGGADSPFANGPGMGASTGAASSGPGSSGSADDDGTSGDPTGAQTGDPSGPQTSTGAAVDCPPDLEPCGVLCVDLQTDATNCGQCGVTCIVPNAESSCEAGACAVGSCEAGFFDCDGSPANGCEAEAGCSAGEACTTACGGVGVTSCSGCDVVCEAAGETCNALDDDCNGQCDEGQLPGCREPVHRANGPNGHYYTNVLAETAQDGRSLEFEDYWWMYAEAHEGLAALYRCDLGSGRFFLTTSNVCEGAGSIDDTLGYLATSADCGATALYRLRSPAGRHFYTTSAAERDNAVNNLGYVAEGTPGYVWGSP